MPLFTSSSPCRKDQFAVSYFSKFKNEAVRNCCHPLEGGAGEGGGLNGAFISSTI